MNVGHKFIIEDLGKNESGLSISRLSIQILIDGNLISIITLSIDDSLKIKDAMNGHLSFDKLNKVWKDIDYEIKDGQNCWINKRVIQQKLNKKMMSNVEEIFLKMGLPLTEMSKKNQDIILNSINELNMRRAEAYDTLYSEEEIDGLLNFYSSSLFKKQMEIMLDKDNFLARIENEHMSKLLADLNFDNFLQEIKELNWILKEYFCDEIKDR